MWISKDDWRSLVLQLGTVHTRLSQLSRLHTTLHERIEDMSDRTDQLTAALNDLSAAVSAAVTKLGDHSDDLVAARLAEDDAAIDGAIAGIRGQVDALKASVPAPPAVPAP